jgi:hypothetical protein
MESKKPTFNTLHELKQKIKPICGKIIRTMDNNRRPCLRPEGHNGGCNPFSDSPPDNFSISRTK